MFKRYQNFYNELDRKLNTYIENQKKYIKCKKGCSLCCEKGEYPLSQPEFFYLTQGFINLPQKTKKIVQQNIQKLLEEKKENKNKRYEHQCPFLINNECCVYNYRGIICRTFGLAYFDDEKKYVRLPDCVHQNLNYYEYYDKKTKILNLENIIKENLRTDKILQTPLAKKYNIEQIEIKPMLEWIEK